MSCFHFCRCCLGYFFIIFFPLASANENLMSYFSDKWQVFSMFHVSLSSNSMMVDFTKLRHINFGVIQGFPALSRKSRNNTREKIRYIFTCVWYSQSAADTSLAFRTTRSGWWMNGKAFTISNPRFFFGIFRIKAAKNLKKSVLLTDSDVQTCLKGKKEPKYEKKNRKLRIQWLW